MHWIQVDDEILKFLKDRADPFVDTLPNSVLRKLLLKGEKKQNGADQGPRRDELPVFPAGTPKALAQVLEMLYLVRKLGYSRVAATARIAEARRVARPTVLAKYCRQLGKKAYEIDRLLEGDDLTGFRPLLEEKFPNHKDVIRGLFESLQK